MGLKNEPPWESSAKTFVQFNDLEVSDELCEICLKLIVKKYAEVSTGNFNTGTSVPVFWSFNRDTYPHPINLLSVQWSAAHISLVSLALKVLDGGSASADGIE